MKKVASLVIVLVLALISLCGCNGDSLSYTEQSEKENNSIASDSYVLAETAPYHEYIEKNKVKAPEFKEYGEIANIFTKENYDNHWGNLVYVDQEPSFKDAKSYTVTEEYTDYMYWGELNRDDKPDGIGGLYECYYYVNYDYSDPDLVIKYIGEFKDGYYHGYGIEFEVPDWDADYYYLELTEESLYVINQPIYEGYFDEGRRSGAGFEIISNLGDGNLDTNEVYLDPKAAEYSFFIGEYKKGKLEGNVLIYYNGLLRYEGGFSKGDLNGKGILYDENGDIVHKGKFADGEILK